MKIFLSWSGEPSRRAAELLRKYLPCMIQDLLPFMSQHDLTSGARWSQQLAVELEQANFGIVCLTPDNLHNPWILFEAGALTKHVEGRACCLLYRELRPADVSGPLAQFQNVTFAKHGFRKLLTDINAVVPRPIDSPNLDLIIEKWWPDLERETFTVLSSVPVAQQAATLRRSDADIMEELLLRVRNIEQQIHGAHKLDQEDVQQSGPERILATLPRQQLLLLGDLVSVGGVSTPQKRDFLERKYSQEDVAQLLTSGVVCDDDGVIVLAQDALAKPIVDYVLTTR